MIPRLCNRLSAWRIVIHHGSQATKRRVGSLPARRTFGRHNALSNQRPVIRIPQLNFTSSLSKPNSLADRKTVHEGAKGSSGDIAFQYDPLTPVTDCTTKPKIRLVELLPGCDSEPVQCVLKEAYLSDIDTYEAISYCWGDPNDRTSIVCNGRLLAVPKTLFAALGGLRYTYKSRLLWADAVCIDQSDVAEKEQQVQLMRMIFSQAQSTLIWLGEGSVNDEHAMSLPAKTVLKFGLAVLRNRVDAERSPQVRFWDTRKMRSYELPPFSSKFYLLLLSMLQNPWFQRAWVVQEVVVSSKATIIWGSAQCQWDDLIRALEFMSDLNFYLGHMPTLQHVASIEKERFHYKQGTNTLLGLLLRQQRCLSTDPRDKVYSFSGLMDTSASERIPVRISYQDDVALVYRRVATSILYHDRTLDFLSQPPALGSSAVVEIPSWVPDWSRSTNLDLADTWRDGNLSLASKHTEGNRGRFKAAGDSECSPELSASSKALVVEGYVFDTVTEVGSVFRGVQKPSVVTTVRGIVKRWMTTTKSFLQTRHVMLHWEEIVGARTKSKYITGEDILEAYWQTVSTGESDSPAVKMELYLWDKVNHLFPYFQQDWKLPLDSLVLTYSACLFLWYAISNKPLLKFEMQARYTLNRRLVRTSKGYIGLASCSTQVGDSVMLCKGSRVPLVAREERNTSSWRLIGDTYIHGIMSGEAFEESNCRKMSFV